MSKKSLKDALAAGIGNFNQDSTEATRSIVNRVAQPVDEVQPEKIKVNVKEKVLKKDSEIETEKPSVSVPEIKVVKPIKFHDSYKTASFLIRNDIIREVDILAKKGGKGWKTRFVNEAIRQHLERYGVKLPE